MKWLIIFASFLLGKLNFSQVNPSLIFFEKAMEKTRGIIFMTTVAFISALLFAAGLIMAAINAFSQYDANGFISINATIGGGITLVALAVISLAVVFAKRNWEVPHVVNEIPQHKPHSPIEEAIVALVQDFIHSRQTQRENPAPPPPRPEHHEHRPRPEPEAHAPIH